MIQALMLQTPIKQGRNGQDVCSLEKETNIQRCEYNKWSIHRHNEVSLNQINSILVVYCYITIHIKLNGFKKFIIICHGFIFQFLDSARQFLLVFCLVSVRYSLFGYCWSHLQTQLGQISKMASSFICLAPWCPSWLHLCSPK